MSEKIIKGYLIKKNKYRSFDQIIQFLDTNGNKITCLSLGSLKVSSKNGMNLFIGSLIEFIIFQSRLPEKISKLKKCHIIEIFD
jgi:recombinational DNA repair protein (RecF pathway)